MIPHRTPKTPEELAQTIKDGNDTTLLKIANKNLICFRCLVRQADMPIILQTDKPELTGMSSSGSKMIWAGICIPCEMFASQEDKETAAQTLFLASK